ncbi:cytochrome P450 [Stereum hirsutum FP-91666 SS1]|uniref:cytochrome P450 n=1 Tax=Stereum hirsutum (strain FP-91666) TaxID=721885 RepID=UPI000444A5B6|nr:cytochrome P450 [Stereum hirsutum FP-91666 SS1]EIM81953.1 cytochrome P450 [Stereum hirsutum FP-91666 SS1]
MPDEPYRRFAELAKSYGSIFSFRLGHTPVIVVNSAKVAWDLLEKRGEIYSSRPRNIMGQEIMSRDNWGLGMAYGDKWRRWRKFQHMFMNSKYALQYRPFQSFESAVLLKDLMDNPNGYKKHFERFSTSLTFSLAYGNRIKDLSDPLVKENRVAGSAFASTMVPGKYLVESWPSLLWLPKPLQWFRKPMEFRGALNTALYTRLLQDVKVKMEAGAARPCLSALLWESGPSSGLSETEMAYFTAMPFAAGTSTTFGSMELFLMSAILHPQCVKKAQAELDAVVGRSRMPTFDDESSLLYVQAMIKESLRWRVVAPIGLAHATTEDDVYMGYKIPKGSTVWGNINTISHDPELFADPETFEPERFLNAKDPRLVDFNLPFGFGRRICPGQAVAMQSLFIVISRMLWAFDFNPALDESGKSVYPDPDTSTSNVTRRPVAFKCALKPRTGEVAEMVREEAQRAEDSLTEWQ